MDPEHDPTVTPVTQTTDEDQVDDRPTPEELRDGNELISDRLETLVFGTANFGEIANYFVVNSDDQDPHIAPDNVTGIETSVAATKDYLGTYNAENGYLAYVPKSGNVYCLVADTDDNRKAAESMGYQPSSLGVYSFRGNQQLKAMDGTGADESFVNAQINLLKKQVEREGTIHWLEQANNEMDRENVERQQAALDAEETDIMNLKDQVAKVAAEKPYLVTQFS